MTVSFVLLVIGVVLVTLVLWLKHQGDMLYGRVIDAVSDRNRLAMKPDEREWCMKEVRRRWDILVFFGFLSASMKLFFPGLDGDEAMLDAAASRCEDTLKHALMHYRQDRLES